MYIERFLYLFHKIVSFILMGSILGFSAIFNLIFLPFLWIDTIYYIVQFVDNKILDLFVEEEDYEYFC